MSQAIPKTPIELADAECRGFLMELYQADIHRLAGLLDRDLGEWLKAEEDKDRNKLGGFYALMSPVFEHSHHGLPGFYRLMSVALQRPHCL